MGETGGIFANDDDLAKQLIDSGSTNCEAFWRLPITEEHRNNMKGKCSDLNSCPETTFGGSCLAAAFLENFVENDVKWAHLDIAGPTFSSGQKGIYSQGTTGFAT